MNIRGFYKTILLSILMVFSCAGYTQNKTIDSLQKRLQTQQDDTSKVNTLNKLANRVLYYRNDHEKAIEYTSTALKLAEKLQYKTGIADAHNEIGNVHATQVKYNEALQYYFKALKIYGEAGSKKGKASAYGSIGRVYAEQARYADARNYYLEALRIKEELGDKKSIGYAYSDVGDLLEREENYPEALTYIYKALTLFEEIGDSSGIAHAIYAIGWVENKQGNYAEAKNKYAVALNTFKGLGDTYMAALMYRNMGEIFFLQGDYEAALKNDLNALEVFEKSQLKLPMAWSYTGIGNIYERQGLLATSSGNDALANSKYAEALRYYVMALEIWKGAEDKFNTSDAYINISNVHSHLNNIKEAKKSLRLSFPIALQIQNKAQFKRYYQSLSQLDSLEGNYKQAYEDYKMYVIYRDSLSNEENTKKMLRATMQYELDKKEAVAKTIQDKKEREVKRIRNLQYTVIASLTVLVLAVVAIAFIQWRNSKHKQKANLLLQQQKEKVEHTLSELKATQAQLIQSEKMASLGELTAGIAHEIQNPLNFVTNFSETNVELIEEAKTELKTGNHDEALSILEDIKGNEEKINHHGRRADSIVKGMLEHSRTSSGKREPTDLNKLADEYLRLSYHGLRAKDKNFNAVIQTNFDESMGKVDVVPQDIGRVLLNLYNNAFYAVAERKRQAGEDYEPAVIVNTKKLKDKIEIIVRDNGNGIPPKAIDKIFQPFFTTKPTGQGTGLGLSLSYDIVKAHSGELTVESKEGEGATLTILLPIA